MQKKSQITLIIIFAIVILLIVAIIGIMSNSSNKIEEQKSPISDFNSIKDYVNLCLQKSSDKALIQFGISGGKNIFFSEYNNDLGYRIPHYYYYNSQDNTYFTNFPTYKKVQEQILNKDVKENIEQCINNFSMFKDKFEIRFSEIYTYSSINYNNVVFDLTFPILVKDNSREITFEKFSYTKHSHLDEMLNLTKNIVDFTEANDELIMWEYLTAISEYNYNITVYPVNDNTLLYRMIDLDKDTVIDNTPYILQFMVKVR